MDKDKIVLVSNNDFVVLKGENVTKEVVAVQIHNKSLNFISYEDISAECIAFHKCYSVKNTRNIRIVEFEDEIYVRAKSDKEAIVPMCIEECGDTLNIVDLLETDCDSTVEDMKGNINQISQNFEIVEGRTFLMEDEFSI